MMKYLCSVLELLDAQISDFIAISIVHRMYQCATDVLNCLMTSITRPVKSYTWPV